MTTSLLSSFRIKTCQYNSINIDDLAASLALSLSTNGATGIVVNNMNINNINCSNASITGMQVNSFTGVNIYGNQISSYGSSALLNVRDNTILSTPGNMTLVNNSYTGVMSFYFNTGSNTVLTMAGTNMRLRSYTGTSIQSYVNTFQLLVNNTGSGNPSYIFALPTPQTLSNPAGALSVNITGNVGPNFLQILVRPSVSTSPANIGLDFSGIMQCGTVIIPKITFP